MTQRNDLMKTSQQEGSQPVVTPAEAVIGGLTALAILPSFATSWPLLFVVGPVYGIVYGLRRSTEFREKMMEQYDELEDQSGARGWLFNHLPVPPVVSKRRRRLTTSERLALTAPQPQYVEEDKPAQPVGFMGGLFGEDNPLERPKSRQQTRSGRVPNRHSQVQPGRPTHNTTRALPALDPDAWVNENDEPAEDELVGLSIEKLVKTVNNDPDTYPFVVIFGPPRSGKTTLAQLIAMARPGKVLILDPKRPKGYEGPKWGGLPYVTKDLEGGYQPMIDALAEVCGPGKEMEWRYQHQETASEPYEQLTVIIDEAKDVVEQCPEIAAYYRRILTIGAEARVRLILISTTDRARKLGFDGEADSLEGFVQIRLGAFAKKVLPEVTQLGDNPKLWAAVNLTEWLPFDNSRTKSLLAKAGDKTKKVWRYVRYNCQVPGHKPVVVPPREPAQVAVAASGRTTADDADDLLAALLEEKVSSVSPAEVKPEVTRSAAEVRSASSVTSGTSDALSDTSEPDVSNPVIAITVLRGASAEEREVLKKALQLMNVQGFSMSAAIASEFKARGGDRFKRAALLIKAWQTLRKLER